MLSCRADGLRSSRERSALARDALAKYRNLRGPEGVKGACAAGTHGPICGLRAGLSCSSRQYPGSCLANDSHQSPDSLPLYLRTQPPALSPRSFTSTCCVLPSRRCCPHVLTSRASSPGFSHTDTACKKEEEKARCYTRHAIPSLPLHVILSL